MLSLYLVWILRKKIVGWYIISICIYSILLKWIAILPCTVYLFIYFFKKQNWIIIYRLQVYLFCIIIQNSYDLKTIKENPRVGTLVWAPSKWEPSTWDLLWSTQPFHTHYPSMNWHRPKFDTHSTIAHCWIKSN